MNDRCERLKIMEEAACDKDYDPLGIRNRGISGIFKLIQEDNLERVQKYLYYGCPLTVKNEENQTPLEYARSLGRERIADELAHFKWKW